MPRKENIKIFCFPIGKKNLSKKKKIHGPACLNQAGANYCFDLFIHGSLIAIIVITIIIIIIIKKGTNRISYSC